MNETWRNLYKLRNFKQEAAYCQETKTYQAMLQHYILYSAYLLNLLWI